MFVQVTDDRVVELLEQSVTYLSCCRFSPKRIAALTGKPIMWEKLQIPRRRRTDSLQQRPCGPDPPSTYTEPNQYRDKDNGATFFASRTASKMASTLTLPLKTNVCHKSHEQEDFSACSDLESGVADLSSRSSCGGEDRKDADSD